MNGLLSRLFSREGRGHSNNPLSRLDADSLDLIQKLVDKSRERSSDRLRSVKFLDDNKDEIERIRVFARRELQKKIIDLVKKNESLIKVTRPLEIQSVVSQSGQLSSPARKMLVKHILLGTAAPPLRTRDEKVSGKEVRQVPELKIVYTFRLGSNSTGETSKYKKHELLIAAISGLNPAEMNKVFKESGFSVGTIKLELRMILSGARGSQVGSIDADLSSEENDIAASVLDELHETSKKVHKVKDDGLGLDTTSRIVLVVDELIKESTEKAVIPIIDSGLIWHTDRNIGSNRRRGYGRPKQVDDHQTTKILVVSGDNIGISRAPVYEEEVYV